MCRCLAAVLAVVVSGSAPGAGPTRYLTRPAEWFASAEAKAIAANVLSHQAAAGGWPKNTDTTKPFTGDKSTLKGTFDNGATTDELRFLARMYGATKDATYEAAFGKGLEHVLKAQYPTGGWPQLDPPGTQYHRHITFNDDAMVRLLTFLGEVTTEDRYAFVPEAKRTAAKTAIAKGVACILKCQILVDGKPTAWCAQHDEKDYSPRPGRTYELVSLSGAESVGVIRYLMRIETPSPEVVRAVEGAVAWFKAAKLTGIRQVIEKDPMGPRGTNKVVVKDPNAPPLWARFYEIGTNKPIFSDRDGVKKAALADIGYERRNGYAWYGTWPQKLLDDDYPAWKKRVDGK
jgi:PelA/Pel-15E family pectate lyase